MLENPLNLPTYPSLPKNIRRNIPTECIDLANEALFHVYPESQLLQPLVQENIIVLSDADHLRFIRAFLKEETHTQLQRQNEELVDHFRAESPNLLRIWTLRNYPDTPILYNEGDLSMMARKLAEGNQLSRDVRKALSTGLIARVLVHEDLHRSALNSDFRRITPDDPLFEYAFSAPQRQIDGSSSKLKPVYQRHFDTQLEIASKGPTLLRQAGARVSLFSEDLDGKYKAIASSGYDLEESIVDTLAKPAYDFIAGRVLQIGGAIADDIFQHSMNYYYNLNVNYNFENILTQASSYLHSLGLDNRTKALHAFLQSRIPQLHTKNLPGQKYSV